MVLRLLYLRKRFAPALLLFLIAFSALAFLSSNLPNNSLLDRFSSVVDETAKNAFAKSFAEPRYDVLYFIGPEPQLEFVSPTFANATMTNNASVYVNVTVGSDYPTAALIDWNRTLRGYWSFGEDDSNPTAFDNSSWFNNGTLQGVVRDMRGVGRFGFGVYLDGDADYVEVPNSTSLDFTGATEFTAELWAYPENWVANGTLIAKGASEDPSFMTWSLSEAKTGSRYLIRLRGNNGLTYVEPTSFTVTGGEWHHFAIVFNGSAASGERIQSYLDGSLMSTDSSDNTQLLDAGNDYVIIGGQDGEPWDWFAGTVDEVKLYARALTAQEINASYNNSAYRLEREFAGLSDGNYSYSAVAIDEEGQQGNTETRTITIDSTPPAVSFVPPTPDNASSTSNTSVYVNVTVTDSNPGGAFIDWNRSLAAYWSMEWYNATGVFDNSTWGNNGTLAGNAVTVANGKYGRGLSLDGSGDYATIASSSSLQGTNVTVMAWINGATLAGDERGIVNYLRNTGFGVAYELQLNGSGTYPQFRVFNGSWIQAVSPDAISTGIWYHLVGQYNRTHLLIWVNGVLKSTTAYAGLVYTNPLALYIGCYSPTNDLFNGTIDEVQVFTRFLSAQEINASYNNGLYRLENNFTGMSGTYQYYGFAVDAAGNQNKTETRTITLGVTTPSDIAYVSPSPLNASFRNYNYSYINVSFTNNSVTDTCLLNYVYANSTNVNFTMTKIGNATCWFNVTSQPDGQANFTVYVNNTAAQWGSNTTYYYFTVDKTAPANIAYVSPTPSNNSYQNYSYAYVNATFTEANPGTCLLNYVYPNSTNVNLTMTRVAGASPYCYLNVTNQSVGEASFTVYVNDSAGNWGSNLSTYKFYVVSYDDVVFNSSFDQGNLINVTFVSGDAGGARYYTAQVNYSTANFSDKHWWFYYRMQNTSGKTVTISINNLAAIDISGDRWPNIEPVYSFDDNETWLRVPSTNFSCCSGNTFNVTLSFASDASQNQTWIAPIPPYNVTRRNALFTEYGSSPYLTVENLGTLPLGINLTLAKITDSAIPDANKRKIYVIAQEHSGETVGSWVADGMIRYLLNSTDATAATIRRNYVFRIIPIINPEGVFYGISRYTPFRFGSQYDLNRIWNSDPINASLQPEANWTYANISAWMPNATLDFHTTVNNESAQLSHLDCFFLHGGSSSPALTAFLNNVSSGSTGTKDYWPETSPTRSASVAGSFAVNMYTRLGIDLSVDLEHPHDNRTSTALHPTDHQPQNLTDWRDWGRKTVLGIYDYFGAAPPSDIAYVSPSPLNASFRNYNYSYINVTFTNTSAVDTGLLNYVYPNSTNVNLTMAMNSVYCYLNVTSQPDGEANFTVYVNNTLGNWGSNLSTYKFYIDVAPPSGIAFVSPTDANNSNKSRTYFYANVTFTESNPDSCLLQRNNTNYTATRSGTNCYYNSTGLSDGDYWYQMWINDSAGNWGVSEQRKISLDVTRPSALAWGLPTPASNSNSSQSYAFANFTFVEANPGNCLVDVDGTNQTGAILGNYCYYNASSLADGRHYFTGYLNDSFGNLNATANRSFVLDVTPPTAAQGTNPVANYNASSATVVFDAKCSDNVALSAAQVWANDTGVWQAKATNANPGNNSWWNASVSGLTDGSFIWGVRCNDTSGNVGWSANRTLNINTTIYSLNISDCGTLDQAHVTYNLTANVSASGTCFTIVNNTVSIDCHGYTIAFASGDAGFGITYSAPDLDYSTIENCFFEKISDAKDSYGVWLKGQHNSIIRNNSFTLIGGGNIMGVDLPDGSKNNVIANNSIGVYAGGGGAGDGAGYGVYVEAGADANTVSGNRINVSVSDEYQGGIRLEGDTCTVSDNVITATSSSPWGIVFKDAYNAILVNNSVEVVNGYALYYEASDNNNATQMVLNTTNNGRAVLYKTDNAATGNRLNDSVISGASADSEIELQGNSGTLDFLNVSFNKNKISAGSSAWLNVSWYVDARVVNVTGSGLENVNLNISANDGTSLYNGTTNSTGWIPRQNVLEFVFTEDGATNYTPHWFNASKFLYDANRSQQTIDDNKNIVLALSEAVAPVAAFGTNPVDNYNSSSPNVTFDFKCSDDVSVDTVQLWGNWTGDWHANYSNSSYANNSWLNVTVAGVPEGQQFVWGVWCNDSAGAEDWTDSNRTFAVDLTAPSTTSNATGINNTWVNYGVTAQLTCTDGSGGGCARIWYCTSVGCSPNTVYSAPITFTTDGTNYLRFKGEDYAGNNESVKENWLKIDQTPPAAALGANPVDNLNSSNNTVAFDFKCSDNIGVDTVQLWGNWSGGAWQTNYSNSSYVNNTWLNVSAAGIPDGYWRWGTYCNDSVGNGNWTTNRTFLVDTTLPASIEFVSPTEANDTNKTQDWFYANASFIESNPDSCLLERNASNYSATREGDYCYLNSTSLAYGDYWYRVWVNDSVGHWNSSEQRKITLAAPDYDDVVFNSSFDQGNLINVTFVSGDAGGARYYTAQVNYSTVTFTDKHWWFYYNMTNALGKTITVSINNLASVDIAADRWPNIEPVYSYDGNETWLRVPATNYSCCGGNSFNVTLTPSQNTVWVAPIPPYPVWKRDELNSTFYSNSNFTSEVIGQTPLGQNMTVFNITDPAYDNSQKYRVYIIAQIHAGETIGSWVAQGLVKYLLNASDASARLLRQKFVFRINPVYNVDGIYYGVSRYTPFRSGEQRDLNRNWELTPISYALDRENNLTYADIAAFAPDAFLDLHSSINNETADKNHTSNYFLYGVSTSDFFGNVSTGFAGDQDYWPETGARGAVVSGSTAKEVYLRLGVSPSTLMEHAHDNLSNSSAHPVDHNPQNLSDWQDWGRKISLGVYGYYTHIPPTVALSSPRAGATISAGTTVFTCTASARIGLANTTLYGDWGTGWHAEETQAASGESATSVFSKALSSGSYSWNCFACDSEGKCDFGSRNYSLTVGIDTRGGYDPSPSPTAAPTATPAAPTAIAGGSTPTPSLAPSPSPVPTETFVESGVSNLSASNASSCVAGVGTKIIVRRVIQLIETPDGVRTRVDLIVSNVGNETAFGVSVNEGLSRVVNLADVEFPVTPNFVNGGAEWTIASLAPGDSKTFSYYVSRRLSESEIASLSAPLVQADSVSAAALTPIDYSLFYAAGAAFALALLSAFAQRFRKR